MKLSIRVERETGASSMASKKPDFRAGINPWKLIKMSTEKALLAAEKARDRIARRALPAAESDPALSLKPLPSETKRGPAPTIEAKNVGSMADMATPISKGWIGNAPGRFLSPRRRFSGSPTKALAVSPSPRQNYRSSFDLKLTSMSRELDTYISRQVLSSVLKQGEEESPTTR
ncbi:hypothetical protein ACLOJK_022101 [Asimina triloba]